jgi:hypothetical protein
MACSIAAAADAVMQRQASLLQQWFRECMHLHHFPRDDFSDDN